MTATACGQPGATPTATEATAPTTVASTASGDAGNATERKYLLERVDDAAVVQVYADGFRELSLNDKILVWHLYQAAIAGRDIYYDQRHALALEMRDVLEAILTAAKPASGAPAAVDSATLAEIERYTKLFWINSGPYNNLSARKFVLACTPEALLAAAQVAAKAGASFPTRPGETLEQLLARLQPMFFDPAVDPMVTAKTPPPGKDILTGSANNLYSGVSTQDLASFKERYGLNSRLVKRDGMLVEEVYKIDGRYGKQIAAVVSHLEAAMPFAPETMQRALRALVRWYQTGEDTDRKAYDIAWVDDKASSVDTINGFIEVYLDARGIKGSWEGIVFYVNQAKTEGIKRLAAEAQWFEDRMPWDARYRKQGVTGITANAIDVVIETGDSGPITPIGINLPNDQSVREQHGSKSVSLSNITEANDKATLPSFRTEFAWTPDEAERAEKWGAFSGELTTNMHEVIGHASGKVSQRLNGSPQSVLKEQFSALEEARADLVALYFIKNPKLVELGLIGKDDHESVVRTEYEYYARNALVQLRRVREGTQIEEDHMRNRQMIIHWLMKHTKAIEVRTRDDKTYYVLNDIQAFHDGVGKLLAEVQRIKGEGDYAAARELFETYGVHFDPKLRDEVVARVDRLKLPSYTGFVMPKLEATKNADGAITDITISYPGDLARQMLEFSAATRALRR
ncbi:MAG: peptidase M49 [Acidimicrobiia bacterium]|nr:peptidase M49 [Acidimicrobiia bacterium]